MSIKKLITLGAFLASYTGVFAQTAGPQLVSVLHPSPNVMAMQKYGDIPVSPYTGVPNISIPIYAIKSHDITVPITLSYHASGIKVGEEASQVGLGWSLNAGGSISRNIIGEDDFLNSTYFNDNTTHDTIETFADGKGPALSLLAFVRNPVATTFCQVPVFDTKNSPSYQTLDFTSNLSVGAPFTDFQPDQYYYNINGLSGKFVLRRDRTVILQKQERIKITAPDASGTTWQIIGTDGTVYNFVNVYETNWNNNSPYDIHKSAWYLTNITSPTGNQVNFHYTVQTVGNILNSTYFESKEVFENAPTAQVALNSTAIAPVAKENLGNIFTSVTLHDIDYDNGRVVFVYTNNRTDLQYDQRLDTVKVYSKDNQGNVSNLPIKTVTMIYDYFTSADVTNKYGTTVGNPLKRLKLTQVVENGYYNNQIVPGSPYSFYYYEGPSYPNLPPKTSFARDHWGYFNGKMNNTSFIPSFYNNSGTNVYDYYMGYPGPERDADTSYTRAYSLKTIVYPTGGSTDFQYETNDYDEQKSIINDHTIYAKQPQIVPQSANFTYSSVTKQYTTSNTLDASNEYKNSSGNILPGTITCSFRLSQNYGSQNSPQQGAAYFSLVDPVTGNEILHIDPANYPTTPSTSAPYVAYSANSPVVVVYNVPFTQQPGVFTWTATITNLGYAANIMDAHTTVKWFTSVNSDESNLNTALTYYPGGGLRIKRIIDHDGVSAANDKTKKFIYHYNALNGNGVMTEYSFGRRMTKPQYSFWQPTQDFYTIDITGATRSDQYEMDHLIRSSDSNISLNGSAEGAAVGYDQVTVMNGENGEDGETVYNYINDPDYVPAYLNQYGIEEQPPFSSDYPNIQNGSLLKQIDYVNNGGVFSKVKELTNTYSSITVNNNLVYGMERRQVIWNYFLNGSRVGADPTYTHELTPRPCENLELFAYQALSSQFNYLYSTDEKLYNLGDTTQFVESISYFIHDNPAHLLTTKTIAINSKGEEITKTVSYPLDFTVNNSSHLSQGIQALQNKNIVSAPVEMLTQRSNVDGTNLRTTSAVLTSYNAGTALPDTIYQMESLTPITAFSSLAASSTVTKDPSYKPVISLDAYDANGNILQQHRIGGPYKSYAWGFNNSFPIAEMTSATPVMAYTSFEETTGNSSNNENWVYTANLTADPSCPSGRYCYNLSNGAVNCSLTLVSTNTYVISYWTKNASAFTIAGTISGFPIKGRTINGWTYFEHKITGQTSLSISGTGFIDELRLYPDGAEMQTFGYDPAVGMTAMFDAKSQGNHFEYDGMMRLQNIKDLDGNITKSFNYHYFDMTVPNVAQSGTYTRNNCPTNTTPGAPFTETIPANKYYAYSSDAANQAAKDELLYNGQNNANIYCSCVPIIVNFSMTNQTGLSGFQAQFSGPSSYTFNFPTSGTSTVQLPAGTYTLTINPVGTFATHTFVLGSRTPVVAPGATFTNVNISTGSADTSIIIR